MTSRIQIIYDALRKAKSPEEVFGGFEGGERGLEKKAQRLIKAILAEDFGDLDLGPQSIKLVAEIKRRALQKIRNKSYGKTEGILNIPINAKSGTYTLIGKVDNGLISSIYIALKEGKKYLVKIAKSATSNGYLQNEAGILSYLRDGPTSELKAMIAIPKFIESTKITNGFGTERDVSIFENREGFVTLQHIIDLFPDGVPPKHLPWMFNRILTALIVAHQAEAVHGAVTPDHVLLNTEKHGGILIGWTFHAPIGHKLVAHNPKYANFYPKEVFDKASHYATDIYMAAACIVAVAGGDVKTKKIPDSVPGPFAAVLRACLLDNPKSRPQDSYDLFMDLHDKVLPKAYGPPSFQKFEMPRG